MIIQLTSAATIALPLPEHRVDSGVNVYAITPTVAGQINATPDGLPGQMYIFKFTTSGVTSYVTTFGTNFISSATLASGTTTAKTFTVTFVSDGQNLVEVSRTAAM